jgi:hypothetical protein|tara:strand:- start:655 stop:1092 length:438 start_codon:yes stop_codon:yes gene_type:complete
MLKEFKIFQVKKDLIEADLQDAFFQNMMNGTEVTAEKLAAEDVFKFVAWINATDLDEVFAIGNGIRSAEMEKDDVSPMDSIVQFARMHSISVGDIIQDEDGKTWVVSSFGFEECYQLNLKGYIQKSFVESTYEELATTSLYGYGK